jgi:hypothetical protein
MTEWSYRITSSFFSIRIDQLQQVDMVSRRFTRSSAMVGIIWMSALALPFTGCVEKGPELIPARGIVTIGGKPAANILLQFLPDVGEDAQGSWPTSYGTTAEDGSFELKTADGSVGAVPGPHKLILVDLEEERPAQGQERTRPIRLDASYAIAGTMSAVVEPDKTIEIVIP